MALRELVDRYNEDHQHPVNRALHYVGIPTILVSLVVAPFNVPLGAALFVFGWILQFVGHAFEGKAPTFFSNPKFLLVGPIAFARKALGR